MCSKEQKATKQEISAEGLILKELPSRLKYAFLEPKKGKLVIISATLTEIEKQKSLKILRSTRKLLLGQLRILKVSVPPFACARYC